MSVFDTAFDDAIEEIHSLAGKFDQAWNDLVNAVNVVIPLLPAYLQPLAKAKFNKLATKKDNALEVLWKLFTERGNASTVRQVASDWNMQVGAKVSNQAETLSPSLLPSHNQWEGPAYIAYKEVVNFQGPKLGAVKTMTDTLQTTLNEIADAMTTYWSGMRTAFGVYTFAMVVGAVTASTEVGALLGIVTMTAASVHFCNQVDELSTAYANALKSQKAALEAQQTLNGTDGNWPSINTDALADASVFDDDKKSGWIPRT